jgi:hypothetical protein
MQTIRQQLAAAYPEHMARIEECAFGGAERLDAPALTSAGDALSRLFVWWGTDEGHEFWRDLAHKHGW